MMDCFNFRLINLSDGNQVIDSNLRTPYSSISAAQMVEYIEIDNKISYMDRLEKKRAKKRLHIPLFKWFKFKSVWG